MGILYPNMGILIVLRSGANKI